MIIWWIFGSLVFTLPRQDGFESEKTHSHEASDLLTFMYKAAAAGSTAGPGSMIFGGPICHLLRPRMRTLRDTMIQGGSGRGRITLLGRRRETTCASLSRPPRRGRPNEIILEAIAELLSRYSHGFNPGPRAQCRALRTMKITGAR